MVAAQGLELYPTAGTPALLGLLGKPEIYRGTRGGAQGVARGEVAPPPPQQQLWLPALCGTDSQGGQRALLLCQAMSWVLPLHSPVAQNNSVPT